MKKTTKVSPNGMIAHNYDSEQEGTHLFVMANIHGNEVCGTHAIHQISKEIEEGRLVLTRGQLTLLPSCNPPAHIANVRGVNVDMNRIIGKTDTLDPQFYEINLAKELESHILSSDVILSIHECSADTVPFAIRDWDTDQELNTWSHQIGCDFVVTGWENIHPGAGDTASFAKSNQKKSLTIECGQIGRPENVYAATKSILASLSFWNMIETDVFKEKGNQVIEVKMMQEIVRPAKGETWLHPISPKNLQPFTKGEVVAYHNKKSYCSAPFNGVFIMPKVTAEPEESWFYLAKIIDRK